MARTSKSAVKNIFDTDLSDAELDEFISDANSLVDNLLSGQGLGSTLLTRIEKYLAAYMASSSDKSEKSATVGDVEVSFIEDEMNPYLARAMRLDTSGVLQREFSDAKRVTYSIPNKRT